MTHRNRAQAWIWAIAINIVVFVFAWVALARIPAPQKSTNVAQADGASGGPGETFGQMTHLMGDSSTSETEPLPPTGEGAPAETGAGTGAQTRIGEFYLDRGPALSFAPRLNPDGTPRPHPTNLDRVKAPTYEDQDVAYSSENCNPPIMSPDYFSKLDLPDELRDLNFDLTVRIDLDARGHVLGRPQIIQGSGHPLVDRLTIDKIMNEARFTPATRMDTGEPIRSTTNFTIWWRNPTPE